MKSKNQSRTWNLIFEINEEAKQGFFKIQKKIEAEE